MVNLGKGVNFVFVSPYLGNGNLVPCPLIDMSGNAILSAMPPPLSPVLYMNWGGGRGGTIILFSQYLSFLVF